MVAADLHHIRSAPQEVSVMARNPNMKRRSRFDDADAFVDDVGLSHAPVADDEAEAFGEEFIATATSGEFVGEDARNEVADDELGLVEIRTMFDEEEAEAS
jgi:hypothetical protein